ncbi:hypothetical protein PPTG_03762 [Phytophthora nicotianae INRA-310]|uniref:Aminoglycoside phosphotransferase domain-containing protein n=4 Tax=Phytophthora nicotianae TaxID=4792 RepID=W2QY40_PHYN3|nr:hypothetical protein PPTG_03762 [Phytophthora nicotianae INRA-310]ETN18043.1 hypothetical protein PPTG_03762 [Phytophthora nicotianae INRA-310]ETO65338.1 hypothetical protein F444_17327 [Phytophthora nicotianae P1976]
MLMRFSRSVEPSPPKRLKLSDLKDMFSFVTWSCNTLYGNAFSGMTITPKRDEKQTECHRINLEEGPTVTPTMLLNEVFAQFDANCKSIELDSSDVPFALELSNTLSSPFSSEEEFAVTALALLNEYLFEGLSDTPIRPKKKILGEAKSDGTYSCESKLLLSVKFHRENGERDSTMHNIGCYIHALPDPVDCQIPSFLLDFSGPLLNVSGIVNVGEDKLVCDPLSVSFPLVFSDNDDLLLGLARLCASLKTAVRELRTLSISNSESLKPPMDQLQFPFKRSYEKDGVVTKFTYTKRIVKCTFEAKTESGVEVIVKFSRTYGKEVHEYCAKAGVAPALLHCETLVSGWIFIVMEKSNSALLVNVLQERGLARQLLEPKINQIRELLRAKNFVHGDLRVSNLMWEEDKKELTIIDFDWAGKCGEVVYPPLINTTAHWPDGVAPGKVIEAAHDEYWLDLVLELDEVTE